MTKKCVEDMIRHWHECGYSIEEIANLIKIPPVKVHAIINQTTPHQTTTHQPNIRQQAFTEKNHITKLHFSHKERQ